MRDTVVCAPAVFVGRSRARGAKVAIAERPDADLVIASNDALDRYIGCVAESLGVSLDELRSQGESGEFGSEDAHLLWLAAREYLTRR